MILIFTAYNVYSKHSSIYSDKYEFDKELPYKAVINVDKLLYIKECYYYGHKYFKLYIECGKDYENFFIHENTYNKLIKRLDNFSQNDLDKEETNQ